MLIAMMAEARGAAAGPAARADPRRLIPDQRAPISAP
ncbi:hypothetical protein [Rhodobacter capsulatus]